MQDIFNKKIGEKDLSKAGWLRRFNAERVAALELTGLFENHFGQRQTEIARRWLEPSDIERGWVGLGVYDPSISQVFCDFACLKVLHRKDWKRTERWWTVRGVD